MNPWELPAPPARESRDENCPKPHSLLSTLGKVSSKRGCYGTERGSARNMTAQAPGLECVAPEHAILKAVTSKHSLAWACLRPFLILGLKVSLGVPGEPNMTRSRSRKLQ